LRTPGPGAALRASALEKLAEELTETEEAFVVVEGRPTQKTRARIRRALAEAAALEGAFGDEEELAAEDEELEDEELEDEELEADDGAEADD
jgi:hypothetical protein